VTPAVVQTLWATAIASALADAGVRVCALSPGSRSTPLALAFAAEPRLELVPIIDERAAAFFALGVARATGVPAAIVCTSGTAAAHYLPAIVEASVAGVPMVAITADRPPELHDCGANQTIPQVGLYGGFPRVALDLGTPEATAVAFRALRRKVTRAVSLARGPRPGPVHLEVPLRKPLEPALPASDDELAFAREVAASAPASAPVSSLAADPAAIEALAAAIAAEPRGAIVVGAMPASFGGSRDAMLALAAATGYPIVAEAGSQLRFGPRPAGVAVVDHLEVLIGAKLAPAPRLVIQLGAEPVAAGWTALADAGTARHVIAAEWRDPDSTARSVIVGDPARTVGELAAALAAHRIGRSARADHAAGWATANTRAGEALARAIDAHADSEVALVRAVLGALPPTATLQLGNSLPVRVVEHCPGAGPLRPVIGQRGASGIDGLVASAAGATLAGRPVALILGDVSFAHDLGGLLAARNARAPLAIVVVDNGGGRIFDALPVSAAGVSAEAYARCFTTPPELDVVAAATALGARATLARTPAAAAAAVAAALAESAPPGVTVIHAPVSATGARDVTRAAIAHLRGAQP
jgi:2-succinyl-5-enolpyruvyl-6-hydroxy-3-cyclohexene-1-carboxylate synthase